jgi:pantoate--beta-alanine ligase
MILLIETIAELKTFIESHKSKSNSIGFLPTMGALHDGHLTLAKKCKKQNDISIVSIFVNPTQFNDKKDLEKYPRNIESDILKLIPSKIDVVFLPNTDEIYPNGQEHGNEIDLGGLDEYMEGAFRPGHFKGVAQVVMRLLEIVTPDRLYMGQKDFQQFTIIQYLINEMKIKTQLIVCQIIREKNGLAMSSRNERLSKDAREKAGIISKTLKSIKKYRNTKSIGELIEYGTIRLNVEPLKVEYLNIVDGNTLKPISELSKTEYAVACVAVWIEGIKLIDNIILKK